MLQQQERNLPATHHLAVEVQMIKSGASGQTGSIKMPVSKDITHALPYTVYTLLLYIMLPLAHSLH